MALQQNNIRRSGRRKILSQGPNGIVYLEGTMGRALPTNRTLRDQRSLPVAARTLTGGTRRPG